MHLKVTGCDARQVIRCEMGAIRLFLGLAIGIWLGIGLARALDIPVMVGSHQLTVRVPDAMDSTSLDSAVAQMAEKLQTVIFEELKRNGDASSGAVAQPSQPSVDDPLVLRINVDGEPHSMTIPRGADIAAGVAKFAQSKGLSMEAQQSMTQQAMQVAVSKGYVPLLQHPVKLAADGPALKLSVYSGQSIEQAAVDFLRSNNVDNETLLRTTPELVNEVRMQLISRGLAPLSTFTLINPQSGAQFPLSLYVGENLTESVLRQCMENGLPMEQSLEARNQVMNKMREQGLIPLSEYPVQVDGTTRMLTLFAGESVNTAVTRFVEANNINNEFVPELKATIQHRLVDEGVTPMASMNIALGPEQHVALPFFKGVAIDDTVSDFVEKYKLPPEEARKLLASVQKRLQDNGLAPLMEISFNISGRKAVLPLFSGQNVTEQVVKFGQAQNISPEGLEDVYAEVSKSLRNKGLAPVAEFTVNFKGHALPISFLQGESLEPKVQRFATQHGIPEEDVPELLEQLTADLVQAGLVPTAQLPVKIGGTQLVLQVFKGETSQQAVAKFVSENAVDPSLTQQLQLGLETRMKDAGLIPIREFAVGFNGKEFSLPLFKGQKIEAAVKDFVLEHKLPENSVSGLTTEVGRRAAANGDIPFVEIPISVRGKEITLPLFIGQDVAKEVDAFGKENSIEPEHMPKLLVAVQGFLNQAAEATKPRQ